MKKIGIAILAVCLGTLGSMAAQAQNTKYGTGALNKDTSGTGNSAFGYDPLYWNTTGSFNSAFGEGSLTQNSAGSGNTADGVWSLYYNTTGNNNAAFGYESLQHNTTGIENTAAGVQALMYNTTGWHNTATGSYSLNGNTTGNGNTATGGFTLYGNTNGMANTANGYYALYSNTTGFANTAVGTDSLFDNTTGGYNIGIGHLAGIDNASGTSYNIDIGNWGGYGDNGVIRIGTPGNNMAFFAAGVFGVASTLGNAVDVMVDSNGQLVTKNSSIRFKEDVHDMAAASDGLMRLRPVTYRYKQPYADGSKPIDYGLIAEEVAQVYPDLVVKNEDGQIQTVQYQKLTPMLLNEVQKERKLLEQQAATIRLLEKRLAALEAAQPSAMADTQLAER